MAQLWCRSRGDGGRALGHRSVGDALPATLIFGVDQVGADRLNLIQDVLLPGEPDGGDQDQRGGTDHHAQRRQGEADLVAQESIVGEGEDLTQSQMGARRLGGGSIHLQD